MAEPVTTESSDNTVQATAKARWRRPWQEPLIYLFILGFVIFGLHALLVGAPEVAEESAFRIEVSSAEVDWLHTMLAKQSSRPPTADELRVNIHQLIRERVLKREAVRLGLDKDDAVVRRRLAQTAPG